MKPRPTTNSFHRIMEQAQSHMSRPIALWSRFIHLHLIELISRGLAATLFRPLPVLYGALGALILPSLLWMIAKYYGYELAGSESLVGFIIGWLVGLIIDYMALLLGRHGTSA